jgi:hypothetical protein
METVIKSTASVQLHPLTETHPVMSAEQYEAFKADLAKNGQLQPVLTYRDKIVDGRHRLRALTELGIDSINVIPLANNLTLEEVKRLVVSTEKRRHQSPTQLAINGYRAYKSGAKQQDAVISTGCSLSNLKHVVALEKLGRLDIIELLEKGGKVDIGNAGYSKFTDSLLGIVTWVKKKQEDSEELLKAVGSYNDEERIDVVNSNIDVAKLDGLVVVAKTSCTREELRVLAARLYKALEE